MKLPDGPSFVQSFLFMRQPFEFLDTCQASYGDIFTVGGKKFPQVFVSNPQAIHQIFTAALQVFTVGQESMIMQPLPGQYSVSLLSGESHQRQRRLLIPPFHGERLRTYGQIICDITSQVIVLATILWRVQPTFTDNLPVKPVRRSFTLTFPESVQMVVTERHKSLVRL